VCVCVHALHVVRAGKNETRSGKNRARYPCDQTEARHRQTNGLGSDHPENDTTIIVNTAGCPCQCIDAPFHTLAIEMSLCSRIPTSSVCKKINLASTPKHNARTGTGKARANRGRARAHQDFVSTHGYVLQDKLRRKARATKGKALARADRGHAVETPGPWTGTRRPSEGKSGRVAFPLLLFVSFGVTVTRAPDGSLRQGGDDA